MGLVPAKEEWNCEMFARYLGILSSRSGTSCCYVVGLIATTVNVDIFTYLNICGFMKMGNFAYINNTRKIAHFHNPPKL